MPNLKTDPLFQLITALKKSEKRIFKLFANRTNIKEDVKFIQLFDALDRMKSYDEEVLFKKVPSLTKAQLSNTKAHLYKQILTSLRFNHIQHNSDIQIRENLDYAKVLYNKGLYQQSLRVLSKAKSIAFDAQLYTLALEVLEFEKLIESQYITRSINTRAEELANQSLKCSAIVSNTNRLSNLAIRLYGLYLKLGYVRNEKDLEAVKAFMDTNLPDVRSEELSFYERLYLYQSLVWYNYIIQDFPMCYRHAQHWVDLFSEMPQMLILQPGLYVKALHNLLAALYNMRHYVRYIDVLDQMERAHQNPSITGNENASVLLFQYYTINRINKHFLEGSFTEGVSVIPEILEKIDFYQDKLDPHRVLIIYYKVACLYFGSGDNINAITYLEKIIKFRDHDLRGDIHCFARILNLIAHYEEGLDEHLEYQIKSVFQFLAKMDDLHLVQLEVFKFLKRLTKIDLHDLRPEFQNLRDKLVDHSLKTYEKRPFLYLDIVSWLESKIENRPVQDIIQQKFLEISDSR